MSEHGSDAFEDGSDDIGSVNLSLYELQELPTSTMAAVELKLALDNAHIINRDLLLHARKLQAENILLRAKKTKATGRLVGEDQKIGWAGAASCVIIAPWIPTSTLQAPRPPTSLDLNDPSTRFASSHSRNAATLAEVYNLLDPSLVLVLENENRRSSFIQTDGAKRRKSDSRIRALLSPVYGDEMYASYPNFPKLLFQCGSDGQAEKSKPFRNSAFPKLLAVILFGPSVLNEARGSRKSSARSNAALWGVTSVTPGAIALVAVVFYFWLSPDTELYEGGILVGHGGCGVSWGSRFDLYKRAILRLPKPDRDSLFNWYNVEVFGKTSNNQGQATNFEDDLSGEEIIDPLGHMLAGLNVTPGVNEEDLEVEPLSPSTPPSLELSPSPLHFTLPVDTEPVSAMSMEFTQTSLNLELREEALELPVLSAPYQWLSKLITMLAALVALAVVGAVAVVVVVEAVEAVEVVEVVGRWVRVTIALRLRLVPVTSVIHTSSAASMVPSSPYHHELLSHWSGAAGVALHISTDRAMCTDQDNTIGWVATKEYACTHAFAVGSSPPAETDPTDRLALCLRRPESEISRLSNEQALEPDWPSRIDDDMPFPPPSEYPLRPRPRVSEHTRLFRYSVAGEKPNRGMMSHHTPGPPYALLLVDVPTAASAFSYSFSPDGASVVVFSSFIDRILADNPTPPPSPAPTSWSASLLGIGQAWLDVGQRPAGKRRRNGYA
ncbi:hypothetical protein K488DRAFT_67734 [Vararia minispora EC-137]|uniref:Uncharacterized protein n=1 Tax=Vararia minispora EC-137 TaxID=1314806 RepID=A0ACB8QWS9_9AGAM|nr:hypothetical protein K488DRAFT_67734 [Vararia minispora EC-137]